MYKVIYTNMFKQQEVKFASHSLEDCKKFIKKFKKNKNIVASRIRIEK